ncbi:MAG: PEP-utilizing enzyme [Candidatus Kerfeldbacteria bacterium]
MNLFKNALQKNTWTLFGRWKEPPLMEGMIAEAITDPSIDPTLPFTPSIYTTILHRQHTEGTAFERHVRQAETMLRKTPSKIVGLIRRRTHYWNKKTDAFKPAELTPAFARRYLNTIAVHGKVWYHYMVLDAALQRLYPPTLKPNFTLCGRKLTPQTLLAITALPKFRFPMVKERAHLFKIAIRMKAGKNVNRELTRHVRNYSWTNSLCWWGEPFTASYYRREALSLSRKNPKRLLSTIEQERKEQYKVANALLKELKRVNPFAWTYIDIVRDLADLKEHNWDAVSIAGTRMRSMFRETARKHRLTYNQLIMHTRDEFIALLEGKPTPSRAILNARMQAMTLIRSKNLNLTVHGVVARELLMYVTTAVPDRNMLKGTIIWPGLVIGKARVLQGVDELNKMKHGEILVCPMTDPDMMPAVHKARAIVTDQGGLLCHAAIVARELRIPCIVGTKDATRLLQTGDMVEVDATKGIVKKL